MKTVLPLVGEYLGTFLLVLAFLSTTNPLVLGAVYAVILFLIIPVSGGAINPAISLLYYLSGKLGMKEALVYVGIQVLAAVSSYYTFVALA